MRTKFYTCIGAITLFLISNSAFGETSSTSIGKIADRVSFGAGIMKNIMFAACIVVGIILLSAAFSQYQIHRTSPKSVPLPVPFTYLILGLIAISIPFINKLTGVMQETPKEKLKKPPPAVYYDIDAP